MPSDAEDLLQYAEARDQRAFAEFVRRNVDLVYAAAYRQVGGDGHLAEDITQGVFAAAAGQARRLARHPVIVAWLHQATRYAAIDLVRSRERRKRREEQAAVMQMNEPAGESVAWESISADLDGMVAALSDRNRDALILRFFAQKSYAEIGERIGVSEGAARMKVERALEKLRARLSKRGIRSSATALAVLLAEKGVIAAPGGLASAATAAAFAPAAVGMSGAIAAFHLMSSAKIIAGVATVVAVVCAATAVQEYRSAQSARLALTQTRMALR